ncbi:unnamed protein product [Oikopleura dioica]|uniref:Troponin T3, fast skeletal type n=2 Tax=Oikopleura dioica TaxID=34765 RepID=E4X554_OIKDI|nr:unnamed protein product [Oikopleura dioica]CBY31830.1 unnamed protein product [Oikopleura dioica]
MIKDHFETRKKDEADLASLQDRIEKRQVYREEQNKIRSEREKARQEAAIEAKKKQEELEERRKKEEEEAKKNALAAMSMNFSGGAAKRERKAGAGNKGKELKKKVLAERRKALNVDHLTGEKLQEKAVELHKWLVSLEESRYDLNISFSSLKDDLKQMRTRVNDLMGKKKTTKVNVRK